MKTDFTELKEYFLFNRIKNIDKITLVHSDTYLLFDIVVANKIEKVLIVNFLKAAEKDYLNAAFEMLRLQIKDIEFYIKGHYTYEVFSIFSDERINNFNWNNFRNIFMKRANKLLPPLSCSLYYASVIGAIKKTLPANYGKITIKNKINIYKNDNIKFDLFMKKFLKEAFSFKEKINVFFNDIGSNPILNQKNIEQILRIENMLYKLSSKYNFTLLNIAYLNQNQYYDFNK